MDLNDYTFGLEIEVESGGEQFGSWLYDHGLAASTGFCGYHECEDGPCYDYPVHNTLDCTADAEFIVGGSNGYSFGERQHLLRQLQQGMLESRVTFGHSVGCHTHIGRPWSRRAGYRDRLLLQAWVIHEDELLNVFRGSFGQVRSNGCTYNSLRNWMNDGYGQRRDLIVESDAKEKVPGWKFPGRPFPINFYTDNDVTVEFRAPNGTRLAWRLDLNISMCAALVAAAAQGRDPRGTTSLAAYLDGLVPKRAMVSWMRQRQYAAAA